MKNIKIKALILCIFYSLFFSYSFASKNIEYDSVENFEKAEWKVCQTATDWCNTFFLTNWKVTWWTLKVCNWVSQKWSCLKYKELEKSLDEEKLGKYSLMTDFEKTEWLTCITATDWCNTYYMTKNGKVWAGTLKACSNFTPVWECFEKDPMVNVLNQDDLKIYIWIKWWNLTPSSIDVVNKYTQKYIDRISHIEDSSKRNNLDLLVISIQNYISNVLKNEKNTSWVKLKLNILNLLKYNIQKEIYILDQKDSFKKLDDIKKMHFSWDLDKDWINDCEKENLCDDSANYFVPRIFKYNCDNQEKFSYYYQDSTDNMILNDNKTKKFYNLSRTISADGERFEGEDNIIWLKWTGAIFMRDWKEFYSNCVFSK